MQGLSAGGKHLIAQTRSAFRDLYTSLSRVLGDPARSGTSLLQATLHAFALQYTEEHFDLVVSLKIFEAIHKLLQTGAGGDSADGDEAAVAKPGSAHTSA